MWIALALILAAALALHHEVIFGGAVYHMDDAADGYYPGHLAVARAFAHGELPVWERGSWCGWPLVVDPYNGVFYPPNIIYYVLGAARGLGFAIVLHVVLGGLGVWVLLRRRRLAFEAALFGGLAYALSTFGVVRIRHVIFVQMMGWLPWILVGVEGWVQSRRRRELVLVAAATALALIAGALSIGHFAALVIAAYTAARCLGDRRRAFADLGALGGAAILGALMAAVQLVPTLAHLPHSPRSLGSDYAFASSYAWPSWRYLATLIMPDYFGGEDRLAYLGAPNHWELAGWYVGALCVALAPLALLRPAPPSGEERRRGAELLALAGAIVLGVGLAFGDAGPVHPFFFRHVPLYAAIRCPARALLMAVLALPILGAHGVEALLERARPRGALVGWIAAAAIALVAALAWRQAGHPPRGADAMLRTNLAAWSHLAWALGAGLAVLALTITGAVPRRAGGLALAIVLAIDLVAIGRGYVRPQPPDYPSGMERFAAVEWLLAHRSADGIDDRFVNDPGGPFRLHNVGMVLGLENASGYDSVAIWRYVDFLYLLANGRPYPEKKLKNDFAAIGVHNLSSRLLDLMNVRWLLSDHPPDARWVERFSPPSPSGAPAARFEPGWDPRMKVFENTTVMPRAFVAYRASVPGGDDALAARLVAPTFDPGAEVFLEEDPGIAFGAPRPSTPARIVEAGRTRLVIDAEAAAPGILFVGDAHYPGWSVTVDGAPARLLRADWAFRGVVLLAGRHRVEMTYRSRPLEIGAALSLLGVLGTLALARLRLRGAKRSLC